MFWFTSRSPLRSHFGGECVIRIGVNHRWSCVVCMRREVDNETTMNKFKHWVTHISVERVLCQTFRPDRTLLIYANTFSHNSLCVAHFVAIWWYRYRQYVRVLYVYVVCAIRNGDTGALTLGRRGEMVPKMRCLSLPHPNAVLPYETVCDPLWFYFLRNSTVK